MMNLNLLRRLSSSIRYDDALAALHYKNFARKEPYDTGLIELFMKTKEDQPKAELVQELVAANKLMRKEWNHLVDTNQKIIGVKNFASTTNLIGIEKYELYTTRHLGSANLIYDYIG